MLEQAKIGRFQVTAREWKKNEHHRIYFSLDSSAQACYDVKEKRFIPTRNRVGARMENAIKEIFELR
jgi:hypothetical protein